MCLWKKTYLREFGFRGIVHKLRLQDEVNRLISPEISTFFCTKCHRKGEVIKKRQNLVNVDCDRPLMGFCVAFFTLHVYEIDYVEKNLECANAVSSWN